MLIVVLNIMCVVKWTLEYDMVWIPMKVDVDVEWSRPWK